MNQDHKHFHQRAYKQQLLDQLYAPYQKCTQCPLGFLGRTTVVFGEGNPDAHLMFIGEGPGAEEDKQGRPFVGRSGKLLTATLEKLGTSRADVFISNVVKCRPPDNRKPLPLESKTCKNLLLLNQIKIIRPKVICALGATAVEGLLEKAAPMTKLRGQQLQYESSILIPTYHPAYILRNPPAFKDFFSDLELAIKTAKE